MRRSASISSPSEAATPGIIKHLWSPRSDVFNVAACIKNPIADFGDAKKFVNSFPAGRTASSPMSGSRMMFENRPDAALFGKPGRTQIVGRRIPIPSRNPRLL